MGISQENVHSNGSIYGGLFKINLPLNQSFFDPFLEMNGNPFFDPFLIFHEMKGNPFLDFLENCWAMGKHLFDHRIQDTSKSIFSWCVCAARRAWRGMNQQREAMNHQ